MPKFNMYMRALFLVADKAIWKRRMRLYMGATVFFIALFVATFFVPMNENYRLVLLAMTFIVVSGWALLVFITWLLKPTEDRYGIDH